jgi:hypothetical protein
VSNISSGQQRPPHDWATDGVLRACQDVRAYVASLRSKIEVDPIRPVHILTEYGVGYRFVRDVWAKDDSRVETATLGNAAMGADCPCRPILWVCRLPFAALSVNLGRSSMSALRPLFPQ